MFKNLIEKAYKNEFKMVLDIRLKLIDYHQLGCTINSIVSNNYKQSISYIEDLYNVGIDLLKLLNTYNIIYNNKKIIKITKYFTKHFNIVPNSLHLINTYGTLDVQQSKKFLREIKRSQVILDKLKSNLPKPSNIISCYSFLCFIGFILGQFFQIGKFIAQITN